MATVTYTSGPIITPAVGYYCGPTLTVVLSNVTTGASSSWSEWTSAATSATMTPTVRLTYASPYWEPPPDAFVAPRIREMIRRRMAPAVIGLRRPAAVKFDDREARARETLRRVVGDDQYRRFLKYGSISLRAASGRTYVIFPGAAHTIVYQDGRQAEQLCVVLRGNFPPTDTMITRYLMLLSDEDEFRRIANKSAPIVRSRPVVTPRSRPISLVDEARKLRIA
jgi:hypothetical protein